jgi:hypothetical protein
VVLTLRVPQKSKKTHRPARQPASADAQTAECVRLEQLRVTLEARVAELEADLATLQAAITAMRRRYPEVAVGAQRKDVLRAREGTP